MIYSGIHIILLREIGAGRARPAGHTGQKGPEDFKIQIFVDVLQFLLKIS